MTKHNKSMVMAFAIVLAGAVAWGGLFGASNKSKEYAEKILTLFNIPELLTETVDSFISQAADQDPNFLIDSAAYKQLAGKYVTWPNLKDKYIKLYTDIFTEDELRQLAAFYASPAGRKSIDKMGEIMGRSSQIVSEAFQERAEELDELISKERIRIANELLGIQEDGSIKPVEESENTGTN